MRAGYRQCKVFYPSSTTTEEAVRHWERLSTRENIGESAMDSLPPTAKGPVLLVTMPTLKRRLQLMDWLNESRFAIKNDFIRAARAIPAHVLEADHPLKAVMETVERTATGAPPAAVLVQG